MVYEQSGRLFCFTMRVSRQWQCLQKKEHRMQRVKSLCMVWLAVMMMSVSCDSSSTKYFSLIGLTQLLKKVPY